MEIFSEDHFERVIRNSVPQNASEKVIKNTAHYMREMLDMGFDDGLKGNPPKKHKTDMRLTRDERRLSNAHYKIYMIGYNLGKGAR